MVENSHKSIEKLFLKKLPRRRQVNDFYYFFLHLIVLKFVDNELQFEIT